MEKEYTVPEKDTNIQLQEVHEILNRLDLKRFTLGSIMIKSQKQSTKRRFQSFPEKRTDTFKGNPHWIHKRLLNRNLKGQEVILGYIPNTKKKIHCQSGISYQRN